MCEAAGQRAKVWEEGEDHSEKPQGLQDSWPPSALLFPLLQRQDIT